MPFREAIKSQVTRDCYERRLVEFFLSINSNPDDFVRKAITRPKKAQEIILEYLLKQKERVQQNARGRVVVDFARVFEPGELEAVEYRGICW